MLKTGFFSSLLKSSPSILILALLFLTHTNILNTKKIHALKSHFAHPFLVDKTKLRRNERHIGKVFIYQS